MSSNKRDSSEMGATEIEQFLSYLAMQEHVAASTQNQALSALLFLYRAAFSYSSDNVSGD
ncbi:phage integrase N-terminal SAM-like domain-containing protein [Trichocoleus desertorum AS-A10]|uniref:phage integrase N-terminal SAM-like domain-containing protein n=1 Tax=Trichocoleus desertorum TaxID=1481672 RepID=UPI00329CC884